MRGDAAARARRHRGAPEGGRDRDALAAVQPHLQGWLRWLPAQPGLGGAMIKLCESPIYIYTTFMFVPMRTNSAGASALVFAESGVPVFSLSDSRGRTGGSTERARYHATRVARDDGGARVGARASEGRLAEAEGGERPCCRLSLQAGHVEHPAATRSRSRSGSLRCGAQSARRGVQCFGARLALRGLVGPPPARRGLLRQRPLPLSPQAAWGRQGRRARARPLEAGGSAEALEGRERPQPDRPPNDPHAPRARSTPSGAAPRGGSTCGVAHGRPAGGGLLAREQDVACRRREGGRAASWCRVLRGAVRHAR